MNTVYRSVAYVRKFALTHKLWSAVIVVLVVGAGWWVNGLVNPKAAEVHYFLGTVATGTVISTVSGSGQVSPSDQVTINPKASGSITRVLVKNGQKVAAGQALAYIDSSDEYNAVRAAQADLKSAQLSLEKLQEPPTGLSLIQSQNALAKAQEDAQTAVSNLAKSYSDGYNDTVSTYVDMPEIMTGLKDIDIGTEASRGTQWNVDYYSNTVLTWDSQAPTFRDNAYQTYQTALSSYNKALRDYQAMSASSGTSTIAAAIAETAHMTQDVQTALNASDALIQLYEGQVKDHNQVPSSFADTSLTNLSNYLAKMNSHVSTLLADTDTITSGQIAIAAANRAIAEDQQSLAQLQAGADALDLQSAQLSVQQKETALAQAQQNLDDYTVRSPIGGTLANLELNVGDTVSSGTAAAVVITQQQIAELSLNEIDAAKVSAGEKATLTFDAIPDLTLTGTVANVSALGAVTQGVVSYTVQIAFDTQDTRIKAGMTVNADIQSAVHQNVLLVPSTAIKAQGAESYVLAFTPAIPEAEVQAAGAHGIVSSSAPRRIPVHPGISDDRNTEILSGVTAGEQIVVRTSNGSSVGTASAPKTSGAAGGRGAGGLGGGIRL